MTERSKLDKAMEEKKQRIDLGLDNPILLAAKQAMNSCMKLAVQRALSTGSMEGSASLKISFELEEAIDKDTGETYISPKIDYKSSYSVPLKDSIDGTVIDICRILPGNDGKYLLINNQISMDELLEEDV